MGRLLNVSGRTAERKKELGRPPRSAAVGQLVYTPDGWCQFLTLPQPRFGSRTALQLIERGEAERVVGALATDYGGAAT